MEDSNSCFIREIPSTSSPSITLVSTSRTHTSKWNLEIDLRKLYNCTGKERASTLFSNSLFPTDGLYSPTFATFHNKLLISMSRLDDGYKLKHATNRPYRTRWKWFSCRLSVNSCSLWYRLQFLLNEWIGDGLVSVVGVGRIISGCSGVAG